MFYEKYCASIISDMTQVVVAVGLVTILSNFVRISANHPDFLLSEGFWLRSALLVLTILFTAYHLLAYAADAATGQGDTGWARHSRGPTTVILLFLIDLMALAAMGAMYGVLSVGDVRATQGVFMIDWFLLAWLAGLAACWHFAIVFWHLIAGSRRTAWLSHFAFVLLQGGLCASAIFGGTIGAFGVTRTLAHWGWILLFAIVIAALYFFRGRTLLRQAIRANDRT
ncbi:hypothetical protein [Hyphococcus luteus]|uniref:DUF1211 domain-containing protein n=1 Tax=Hyphococcus luteus TaxID=2058213 RepID=A0A2S7K2P5_9PROT|nr:hypothetical protein [Marinicaulis flavus]PQA86772.1 hypothetical protein CW354_14880 [Marinicaulis flavus]